MKLYLQIVFEAVGDAEGGGEEEGRPGEGNYQDVGKQHTKKT